MRAGLPLTYTIEFASGIPDANVVWRLTDGAGVLIATNSIIPPPGSVSVNIQISPVNNLVPEGQLHAFRELQWEYQVGGVFHTGVHQYTLIARLPYGVSPEGVRKKLGVESHELEDDEIDLLGAYLRFESNVTPGSLAAYVGTTYPITHAIEAQAALDILPTLQVRLANKETSGTNAFQRQSIDWELLASHLMGTISEGLLLVDPTVDLLGSPSVAFVVVTRETDLFPGG